MNHTFSRRSLLFIAALSLSACASIVSGGTQPVTFNSAPDGATVTLNGLAIGKTPITTAIKKKSGQTLIFSKEGYKPVTMQLETRMNGWFWGNIAFGGLIGSTTDGLSGAVHEYSPSQYMVSLQPEGTGALESKTTIASRQKAKEFILISYKNIQSDLSTGDGEYLNSLLELLKVPKEGKVEAVKKLRALAGVYPNILEFTERVLDLYLI
ncbi:MAG: PEGA domain-containing protein [Elusimicrobia bacterium]|nr:PEGA domain-containing protein [Elusimicrobiota bacterium]